MKVVVVSLMREKGTTGVQTHMRQFASQCIREGTTVDIITPFSHTNNFIIYISLIFRNVFKFLNKAIFVFLYHRINSFLLKQSLKKHLLNNDLPELFYAQCPCSANVIRSLVKGIQPKIVLVVHFNESQALEWEERGYIKRNGIVYNWLQKETLNAFYYVSGVLFVSNFMKKALEQKYEIQNKSEVIYNFIEDDELCNSRKIYDLLMIGTLEPRKNQQFLLSIVKKCHEKGHLINLALIGEGEDRQYLEKLSKDLGIEKYVTFLGFKKNASDYLNQCKLYIHSARRENLSITLIEALRASLPIAALPVGGNLELVKNNINGIFLDESSLGTSADKVADLLADEKKRICYGKSSRQSFELNFKADVVIQKYNKYFDKVINQ